MNQEYKGGCHCGAVRFSVVAPADLQVVRCTCSICQMTDFLHLIVDATDFRLLTDENKLCQYSFATHTAKHLFCPTCGIKSFYIPRSHPAGISVNVRCLDQKNVRSIAITTFHGHRWEENISQLFATQT